MSFPNCGDYFALFTVFFIAEKKELIRTLDNHNGGFDDFKVILIIAFVLATITWLIFFDGIIRRTHLIANKKSTQNIHNLQIQIIQ